MKHLKDWGPGYRLFICEDCLHEWKEKSRDCTSPSISVCPECNEVVSPYCREPHYEWPTDGHGNLLREEDVEE